MKFMKGNLLELAEKGEFDVITHGCNCLCVMGAGIALAIANRYPIVYEADMKTKRGDYNKLGNFTYAPVTTKTDPISVFNVVNAYTQYTCSDEDPNKDMFEYEAFILILKKLHKQFGPNIRYGFPLIGCGLARGNKEIILKILEKFSSVVEKDGSTVTIVELP
jgi:O-acetyl-ADP-ribose deacetylase (regulator of RNase III)